MALETGSIYIEKANKLQREGKLNEAAAEYRRGIELNPNFCWYHHNLGEVLAKQGDLDGAIASYRRAIELNSNSAWSYHNLGVALIEKGLLDEAVTALNMAIQLLPDSYQCYDRLGKALAKKGEWFEAIANYKKALEIHSKSAAQLYNNLGEALGTIGKIDEAIACYNEVMKLCPNSSEVYRKLAELFGKKNRFPEAASSFQKALDLEPNDYSSYEGLGNVLVQLGNPKEAISAFQKALELRPQERSLYGRLGALFSQLGRWQEAAEMYRRGVERGVNNHKIYYNLAIAEAELGNWSEVVIASNKALELQPNNYKLSYRLGNALCHLEKWSEAAAAYRQSLKIEPNYGYSYAGLGNALANLNNWSEAIAAYRQAIDFATNQSLDYLHKLYQKLNQILLDAGKTEQTEIYDRIWHGLNQFDLSQTADFNYPQEIDSDLAYLHFACKSKYKVISLHSLTDADREFLENSGLSVANLQLINQDNIDRSQTYVNSFLPEGSKIDLVAKFNNIDKDRLHIFQQVMVETGYIYAPCPITGKILRSNQSLLPGLRDLVFFYRFVAEGEIFYLIAAGMRCTKKCLYFPQRELIIHLQPEHWAPYINNVEKLLNLFKTHTVSCWNLVKTYILNKEPKKTAIAVGITHQIGHYLLNELTGVHTLYEMGALQKVNKFFIGPYDYFNLADLYPEVPEEKIVRMPLENVAETVLSNNLCSTIVDFDFIKKELARRISVASQERCSPDFRERVQKAKEKFPLILINIRTHRRCWISQVTGIANVIQRLYQKFPNLGVVFDGWSRVPAEANSSESNLHNLKKEEEGRDRRVEKMISQEKAVVKKILRLIPAEIEVFDTIGCMTYESVVWADSIDFFIGTYGSGLVYVIWIANKPGVVHGNKELLSEQNTGPLSPLLFREEVLRPSFLPPDLVVNVQNKLDHSNYDCNWKDIYNRALEIAEKIDK